MEQVIVACDSFHIVKKQTNYKYHLGILMCVVKLQSKAELLIQNAS